MLHFNLGNLELVHFISLSFHFDYEKFVQISTGNCSLHFLSESCERDFNQICQSVSKLANIAGARMRHLLSTACSCFSSCSWPLGSFAYVVICASQFACMFAHSYFFSFQLPLPLPVLFFICFSQPLPLNFDQILTPPSDVRRALPTFIAYFFGRRVESLRLVALSVRKMIR